MPIFLIANGSILGILDSDNVALNVLEIIGNPIIALVIGVLVGLFLLKRKFK